MTVVITCYNYARFLRQAAESALGQDAVAVDLVIVDDASTDDSLDVARALAAADPRVQVIAAERNLGAVGAFNRGLESASGDFLVRLDADDLLTPGSLGRAVAVMQAHPAVGLVYGHPIHFSGETLPPPRIHPTWWNLWSGSEWLANRCAAGTNAITSPEVVMRRSVVERVGGMRPLAHTHDFEWWLRIAAHSDVGYVGGADQAWHREHPASLSMQAEDPLITLGELRAAFDELLIGLGPSFPRSAELRALSRRAVAAHAVTQALRHLDRGNRSEPVGQLQAFALETDPEITTTASWRRLQRQQRQNPPRAVTVLRGVPPRITRRIRVSTQRRRWHRTGVYERIRIR